MKMINNILVGPSRFELELLPPQGRRMPSYPTGPMERNVDLKSTYIFYYFYGFQTGDPSFKTVFPAIVFMRIDAAA